MYMGWYSPPVTQFALANDMWKSTAWGLFCLWSVFASSPDSWKLGGKWAHLANDCTLIEASAPAVMSRAEWGSYTHRQTPRPLQHTHTHNIHSQYPYIQLDKSSNCLVSDKSTKKPYQFIFFTTKNYFFLNQQKFQNWFIKCFEWEPLRVTCYSGHKFTLRSPQPASTVLTGCYQQLGPQNHPILTSAFILQWTMTEFLIRI
jgi:hypothetical protein